MPGTRIGPTAVPALAVGTAPNHPVAGAPPLAVQLVAFVVVHDSDVEPPTLMMFGVAAKLPTPAGGVPGPTTSDALEGAPMPPGPEHVSV